SLSPGLVRMAEPAKAWRDRLPERPASLTAPAPPQRGSGPGRQTGSECLRSCGAGNGLRPWRQDKRRLSAAQDGGAGIGPRRLSPGGGVPEHDLDDLADPAPAGGEAHVAAVEL